MQDTTSAALIVAEAPHVSAAADVPELLYAIADEIHALWSVRPPVNMLTPDSPRSPSAPSSHDMEPDLTIAPLTAEQWPALEDLFGPSGASNHRSLTARARAPGAGVEVRHAKRETGVPLSHGPSITGSDHSLLAGVLPVHRERRSVSTTRSTNATNWTSNSFENISITCEPPYGIEP